jgi:hypothetical protein
MIVNNQYNQLLKHAIPAATLHGDWSMAGIINEASSIGFEPIDVVIEHRLSGLGGIRFRRLSIHESIGCRVRRHGSTEDWGPRRRSHIVPPERIGRCRRSWETHNRMHRRACSGLGSPARREVFDTERRFAMQDKVSFSPPTEPAAKFGVSGKQDG